MNAPLKSSQLTVLTADHYALFGLAPAYAIDEAALSAAYKSLQQTVHPDRFANASEADKRAAMQSSAQVNEAYKTLRDPLSRAAYLCELKGEPIKAERHTAMPPAFLMQQLHWREALADAQTASDENAINALEQEVSAAQREGYAELARLLDAHKNFHAAATQVRALMFIDKFSRDVADALDALTTH